MGLKTALDVAQSIIEEIMPGLDVETCIDDIGIFSENYDEHLAKIDKVLQRLQDAGCKINLLKSEWCVQETYFFGDPQAIP